MTRRVRALPPAFDAPDLASVDPWALALSLAAAIAIFRFQGRDDPDARRLLRGRRRSFPVRRNRMSSTVKLGEGRTQGHALN